AVGREPLGAALLRAAVPGAALRPAGRHRQRHRLPLLGGGLLHHRPGAGRRRRALDPAAGGSRHPPGPLHPGASGDAAVVVAPRPGVRDATAPGPSSLQTLAGRTAWIYEDDGGPAEDCLSLNVWTPGLSGARPVLVWFHGGSFQAGHAALPCFDGRRLARDGDAVVVTCNYRLGALGWLAHPDLRDPDTGHWANWGLQDQAAALRWVRENIARFGGDPGNVTLFGESAGAMSIAHLARHPANRGL